jgi:hypothetical protein
MPSPTVKKTAIRFGILISFSGDIFSVLYQNACLTQLKFFVEKKAVLRIRIRIRIHRNYMFLGLPDPDPLVRGMDPDPDPALKPDPDHSIIMQK